MNESTPRAPLAVFEGDLYAGSQKDGWLMRFVAD